MRDIVVVRESVEVGTHEIEASMAAAGSGVVYDTAYVRSG